MELLESTKCPNTDAVMEIWEENNQYYVERDSVCVAVVESHERAQVVVEWWLSGCPC